MAPALVVVQILVFILMLYMSTTSRASICVVISNVISAILVFIYCILQAPDIAITEAVIGTASSTILFALVLLYIKKLPSNTNQNFGFSIDVRQKLLVLSICVVLFWLLIYFIQNLPKLQIGEIENYKRIAKLYVDNAIKDFGFSSIVTAVVAGYRGFDTMFENVVIFTACYGFYDLITMDKKKKNSISE